ncbi:hypothetical protein RND81_01G170000 [Saponaria officinalis]|uniref:Tf2-1-like SH3-like domain-containing protein n=1 Tax=Saponaria officinalis TaxID=3572 RepID=A0AAW1NAF9_SAPOF
MVSMDASWYNTNFHLSTQSTPFQIVYSQSPHVHIPYVLRDSQVAAVDISLAVREEYIKLLQFHLKRSQDRIKNQADNVRSDKQFLVGDAVYVKLQPYRKNSVAYRTCAKLAPKYFGPLLILDKVGEVAYKLKLPADHSKVYHVFHISQLKKHEGPLPARSVNFPEFDEGQQLKMERAAILDRKLAKQGNKAVVYVLVQRANATPEDATCESYDDIVKRFPKFDLTA